MIASLVSYNIKEKKIGFLHSYEKNVNGSAFICDFTEKLNWKTDAEGWVFLRNGVVWIKICQKRTYGLDTFGDVTYLTEPPFSVEMI